MASLELMNDNRKWVTTPLKKVEIAVFQTLFFNKPCMSGKSIIRIDKNILNVYNEYLPTNSKLVMATYQEVLINTTTSMRHNDATWMIFFSKIPLAKDTKKI